MRRQVTLWSISIAFATLIAAGGALAGSPTVPEEPAAAHTPSVTPQPVEHGTPRCPEYGPMPDEPHSSTTPAPNRPWADGPLLDELLDHAAAIIETLAPHGADGAAAEAALTRYFALAKTSPEQLIALGKRLEAAMNADRAGFSEWMTNRIERLQDLAEEAQRLSPEVQTMLSRVFGG